MHLFCWPLSEDINDNEHENMQIQLVLCGIEIEIDGAPQDRTACWVDVSAILKISIRVKKLEKSSLRPDNHLDSGRGLCIRTPSPIQTVFLLQKKPTGPRICGQNTWRGFRVCWHQWTYTREHIMWNLLE